MQISNVFVNIDPIFGNREDELRCEAVVREYFPAATLFKPERPSFCSAVKRLWGSTVSKYIFHLEDDWISLEHIGQEVFEPFEDPSVMQVSLHHADQNWDIAKKGNLHRRNEYSRFWGLKIPLFRKFPKFTTSPSLVRGDFGRQAASVMDETRDPEKQFYSGVNLELERLAAPNLNFIFAPRKRHVIHDIGREWREANDIGKVTKNATSYWVHK